MAPRLRTLSIGEKTREQKDKAQREAQNQQYAGSSYHVPDPDDVPEEEDLSGLPWGSFNMRHVVSKGHATASHQGSRPESDPRPGDSQYLAPYTGGYTHVSSFDAGSSGDDRYYDDSPYYYDYDAPGGGSSSGSHQM
jgi:hypothetical protein